MPSADFHIRGDTTLDAGGFESGVSRLGSMLKKAVAAIGLAKATAALANAAKASVKLASDLTEVQNVVDTTFGDNAGAVNEWAANAAEAFGMSELQAKQFNGTMGAMLKSMGLADDEVLTMSTSMVGLAGDFASFYNLDHQEAFDKIRAGISGETEPLKQLGINMSVANLEAYALSQGITKSYTSMTQAEQATLRYNYLMSTTADAQGDFAKTSGSLANQLRIAQLQVQNLGAAIGEALLPMATQMVGVGVDMLGKLTEGFQQGGVEGLLAAAQGIIAEMYNSFVSSMPQMIQAGLDIISNMTAGLAQGLPDLMEMAVNLLGNLVQSLVEALPQVVETGSEIVFSLIQGILNSLASITTSAASVISSLVTGIVDHLPEILRAGIELIQNLIVGIGECLPDVVSAIGTLVQAIWDKITTTNWGELGVTIIETLIEGVLGIAETFVETIGNLAIDAMNKFMETDWSEVGKNLVRGLIDGVTNLAGDFIEALGNMAISAYNAVTSIFQEHSPSRLFRDKVGAMLPLGAALGVEDETPAFIESLARMARSGYDAVQASQFGAPRMALQPALAGGVSSSTSSTQYITQYNAVTIDAKNVKDFSDVVAVLQNHEKVVRQGYTRR